MRALPALRSVMVIFLVLSFPGACHAQSQYDLESRREWILSGAGAALGVASLAILNNVEPLTVGEIERLDVNDINDFDRRAVEPYRETQAGDALLYASYLLPLTFLAYPHTKRDWKNIGVMWVETTLINIGLNGVIKGLVLRTRPYVYDPNTPLEKKTESRARLSFYSGHTSSVAANSFFVARVFSDYLPNRKTKALVWTGAVLYPMLTAFSRRDSGHHFRTDVIVGYCVGASVGYFVPELHRRRGVRELSLFPCSADGGIGAGLSLAF